MGGLPPEDVDAFVAGRLVLADLAAKASVSPQAASKWLRRRGLGRSPTAPSAGLAGATTAPLRAGAAGAAPPPTGTPAAALSRHEALADLGHDQAALRSVACGALIAAVARANHLLAGTEPLGPSGLKGIVAAVVAATETLSRLGALVLDEGDAKKPTELHVRVMTAEETAAIVAGHEADDQMIEAAQDDQAAPTLAGSVAAIRESPDGRLSNRATPSGVAITHPFRG